MNFINFYVPTKSDKDKLDRLKIIRGKFLLKLKKSKMIEKATYPQGSLFLIWKTFSL